MTLLRCPKFLRCLTADAENFDRGHSLTSLSLPPAALSSLPTSARPTALLAMCHCEASALTGCDNPSPVSLAPLPKGGWHGEAVTGGYLTAPLVTLRRGDPCGRPRAGKSAKRRRWRMKQAGFEEVPRLAGTTVAVSRLARRWAREPLPYAPSRTHCIGRTESSAPTSISVGAILAMSRRTPKPPHYFSPPLVLPRRMCYNFLIKVES